MVAGEHVVVADDGVRLWASASGHGEIVIVLCHGGPGLWDELEPVAAMLDDIATVIRWDQRGAGRSDRTGPYSVQRCIADLDCVRSHFGVEEWTVAGHSWGAGLALRYTLAHRDRVTGLVYISGTDLHFDRHQARYRDERLRRLGSSVERWRELREKDRTAEEEEELNRLTFSTDFADRGRADDLARRWGYYKYPMNFEANAAINRDTSSRAAEHLEAQCARLDLPAVVIHGEADPRPVDGPAELAACLPSGRFVVLPGVGHVPWAESPQLLAHALREFIASLDPPAGERVSW